MTIFCGGSSNTFCGGSENNWKTSAIASSCVGRFGGGSREARLCNEKMMRQVMN